MAESWTLAFGRYLRTLRERRGLSLDEVQELSRAFPDPIQKGYLSKCENGRQGLAMSKLVPLCRIYDVPAEVLVERLQLDMELEKEEAPDTEGMSYHQLTTIGASSVRDGFIWRGYAFLRDAVPLASAASVDSNYSNHCEQTHLRNLQFSSAALSLGAVRFALHEARYISEASDLSPKSKAIALRQIAQAYRRLGNYPKAKRLIESAIAIAREHDDEWTLGHCLSVRAVLATAEEEFEAATRLDEEAYTCFRNQGLRHECARSLGNLAQGYFYLNRLKAARRAIGESLRIAEELGLERNKTLSNIFIGELDLAEGRLDSAERHLRKATQLAESTGDKVHWFKAQFHILRHAIQRGSQSDARRLYEALAKLKARIPSDTPELLEFNEIQL